jgi:hypothetical protein
VTQCFLLLVLIKAPQSIELPSGSVASLLIGADGSIISLSGMTRGRGNVLGGDGRGVLVEVIPHPTVGAE